MNAPSDIKKAIIHNLISRAKLISSSKTIFYKEVENIKQALINNGFPNYIVDEQIKRMIKIVNQQNKHCTTPPSQQTYIKPFYRNQMHYKRRSYIVVICKNKSYITFVINPPLTMAQSRAESTRDTYNYGQYINQFPPNTIKAIQEYEWIQKKICRQKMSIMFNEISRTD